MVTGVYPPDIGGPARFVPHLADELVKQGISCQVITLSERLEGHQDSLTVYRIRRAQNIIIRVFKIVAVILKRARSVSVVLVNGLYFEATIAALLAGRPTIIKIVSDEVWEQATRRKWVTDTLSEFQFRRNWKIDLLRFLRRFSLKKAASIVVPSLFTKTMVTGWLGESEKIRVIYNAGNGQSDYHSTVLPDRMPGKCRLITASRLIPLKRIDQLIKVVANLGNVTLVIVGDGPERASLESLARDHQIEECVTFTGPLSGSEVLSAMASSDIFVLNSSEENFPHVILEAMAVGLPVVATRVGGIPEVITSHANGLLVSPYDPDEISHHIQLLVNDPPLRQRLSQAGRETAKYYSWEMLTDQYITLFKQVAGLPS